MSDLRHEALTAIAGFVLATEYPGTGVVLELTGYLVHHREMTVTGSTSFSITAEPSTPVTSMQSTTLTAAWLSTGSE